MPMHARLAHTTSTFVTLADPIVPDPLPTRHVCPVGWVPTVTAYAAPLASGVANVNAPFALRVSASPPLFRSVTESPVARPETVPPTVYVFVEQVMLTFVTLADAMVPEPLPTTQVCPVGCVPIVTK